MKKYYWLTIVLFFLSRGIVSAQYTDIHDFNGTTGSGPWGSLTLVGNKFYGMTETGGANTVGVIFSVNMDGSGYQDIHDFDFHTEDGRMPFGSLVYSKGMLYGMTQIGGAYGAGCIFSIDTNGNKYKKLLDFDTINGQNPYGSLTLSGGVLYGVTRYGGANGKGLVFSVDTNGSGYHDLFDFNGVNGANPSFEALVLSGNILYGTTGFGGNYNDGCIFSVKTNGSGYKRLFDFDGTNGFYPCSSLTLSGKVLYGDTYGNTYGKIFSIDTNGSGFKDMFDFKDSDGVNLNPITLVGGRLYGTTPYGGGNGGGVIFSIDTNGNGFKLLYNFDGTSGKNPEIGNLIFSGGMLYGMTLNGGAYSNGAIFRFDTSTINIQDSVIDISNVNCFGDSIGSAEIVCKEGTPPYSYSWSPGGYSTSKVSGLHAGTYTVTVSDWNHYTIKDSVTITQPLSSIQIHYSTVSTGCKINNGSASVNVSGATPPYTYLWSASGGTDSIATRLSAGYYTCTVTDSLGCRKSSVIDVKDSGTLKISKVTSSELKCFSDSNAIAIVNIEGGGKPYIYSWSPYGGTDSIAQNLIAGSYLCTVTDSNDCKMDTIITITQPAQITINKYTGIDTGICGGSAWVNVSGGTTPYNYLWSNGLNTDSILGQCYGTYCCTINDANGCIDSACIDIVRNTTGIAQVTDMDEKMSVFPNPNNGKFTIQVLDTGGKGRFELYNVLGKKVFTKILSNIKESTIINITSQPQGIYFYKIILQNGNAVAEGQLIIQK